jgi:hypothetical protein
MNFFQIQALISETMREQGVDRLTATLLVQQNLSEEELEIL